jgi:alkyldihydroxyacetonephosphate synthase
MEYPSVMLTSELANIVGGENISVRETDKVAYSCDNYWIPRLWIDRGRKCAAPDVIVHVENREQISLVLQLANQHRIPVIPWGGGSGSQGGALPVRGGIILDLKKINRLLEINPQSMTYTTECGIIQQTLEWELNKHGYSTMHLPASAFCATLGGYLAHRGSGVASSKYGKIEDLIVSMEVVLPDGTIIQTPAVPRHAAGPDLNQLFIGSEGTLGIITRATMKMFDMPEKRLFRAFLFDDMSNALEAGRVLMTNGSAPSVLRLYDPVETRERIKTVLDIDTTGAYVVYGFDGPAKIVDVQENTAREVFEAFGAEDLGPELGERWWERRFDFYFPPKCLDLPLAFGTMDTVATYDKIEGLYWGMKEAVESNFPEATFIAHFSHWYHWGCTMYCRFIIREVPDDSVEAVRLYNSVWDVGIKAALENGGVLNDHHGIGLKLGQYMRHQYGDAFRVIQSIKNVLDPNHIMNPGKMGL